MSEHSLHTELFQTIYNETYEKVFHFVLRLTASDEALTDDLVQNVYLALWEKIEQIEEGNTLPLLYTIAKRQLINHHRKVLAEQVKLSGWLSVKTGDAADSSNEQLIYREINHGMEKVLSGMPERRRIIFLLCREEGLSYKEIALHLNMSVAGVQQQMNLALKSFRKEFGYPGGQETAILLAVTILSGRQLILL